MKNPVRKNLRFKDYDYSTENAYFVTICTHNRQRLFCEIRRGDPCGRPIVEYTLLGNIAKKAFGYIEEKFNIMVLQYAIMPDHIHAIILIDEYGQNAGAGDRKGRPYSAVSLPRIIGAYKSVISGEWLKICKENNCYMGRLWQRSYFDHIIRNHKDMQETIKYIYDNPIKWCIDNKIL